MAVDEHGTERPGAPANDPAAGSSEVGLRARLQEAARAGRPGVPGGLGAGLVRRGRRRRMTQQVGGVTAALVLLGGVTIGVTSLDRGPARPVVTDPTPSPSESIESVEPSPSPSSSPEVQAAPASAPTPVPTPSESALGEVVPSELPTPASSPSPSPSPSPTPAGGADDVGVTADTVRITAIAHGSTSPLGTGDPSVQAMRAYLAYVEEEFGTIHGRRIELVERDGGRDPNVTMQAYRQACEEDFAVVGLFSVADEGGAAAQLAARCEMPDIRARVHDDRALEGRWTWAVDAAYPFAPSMAGWEQWADRHGDVVAAAGWYRDQNAVADRYAADVQEATESLGYEWILDRAYLTSDPSTTSYFLQEAQLAGVEFIHFDGDPVSLLRFMQQARERDYHPVVTIPEQLQQAFAETGYSDPSLDGVEAVTDEAPFAEWEDTPGGRRYVEWLDRTSPGVAPSIIGMYSWASAELFVEALKAVGPVLTRDALANHLEDVAGFTADGLLGARTVAGSGRSDCIAVLAHGQDGFRRVDGLPPGRLSC